jgi:WS/DGAT/MGAT family acyltransferase
VSASATNAWTAGGTGGAPLSGLDALFVAAERPGAALHTMAILVLDPTTIPGGYEFERFRATVASRAASGPLMRRLVAGRLPWQRPRWVDVDRLDVDRHVVRSALPPPGDAHQLAQLAAWIDEQPLDRAHPLWAMHVVEGLHDGSIALVCKLSHALMDGVAGMEFMASFFTTAPDDTTNNDSGAGARSEVADGKPTGRSAGGIVGLVRDAADELRSFPAGVARTLRDVITATGSAATPMARRALHLTLPRPSAPRVRWNTPLTPTRSVAFTEVDLDDVRDTARLHGVTVNDVLLAIVAGALRDHLLDDHALPDRPLIAAVPVSVHGEHRQEMNAVSVMLVPVASDCADPSERVATIHTTICEARRAHDERGPGLLMTIADLIPTPVVQFGAAMLVDVVGVERLPPICNFMLSNVAGPPVPLYIGGARLRALFPLGPIFPGMGLNVTAVSREHKMGIGLVSCPAAICDLWSIADSLPKHLDDLRVAR